MLCIRSTQNALSLVIPH
eukprot:Gb_33160 [translate_table: standard]